MTYFGILSEEHPRRIFNIIRLELSTGTFGDPLLTLWQERCEECAEFQFRKLHFSGFPYGWKTKRQVILELQQEGWTFDPAYFYCRKYRTEMLPKSEKENAIIIDHRPAPWLGQLLAQKGFRIYHYSTITDFVAAHIGTWADDSQRIPEFKPAPADLQASIVMFIADISKVSILSQCRTICAALRDIDATIVVVVPSNFQDIDAAVDVVRRGAVTIIRKGQTFLKKFVRVLDLGAPISAAWRKKFSSESTSINQEGGI